jgi:hypothetical protein
VSLFFFKISGGKILTFLLLTFFHLRYRMLAVMTMNIGYFLAVVAGTFVGSVLLGGHTVAAGH